MRVRQSAYERAVSEDRATASSQAISRSRSRLARDPSNYRMQGEERLDDALEQQRVIVATSQVCRFVKADLIEIAFRRDGEELRRDEDGGAERADRHRDVDFLRQRDADWPPHGVEPVA